MSISLKPDVVKPLIFQPMKSIGSNNLSLKVATVKISGCKDIAMRIFELLARTQLFWVDFN